MLHELERWQHSSSVEAHTCGGFKEKTPNTFAEPFDEARNTFLLRPVDGLCEQAGDAVIDPIPKLLPGVSKGIASRDFL